jgi:hypothetical protein
LLSSDGAFHTYQVGHQCAELAFSIIVVPDAQQQRRMNGDERHGIIIQNMRAPRASQVSSLRAAAVQSVR